MCSSSMRYTVSRLVRLLSVSHLPPLSNSMDPQTHTKISSTNFGIGEQLVLAQDVSTPNESSTWRPPANDRLSAVQSSGIVRDPSNPNFNIDLPNKEETRPKRASSIGASIRRLFFKSPSHAERSSSETSNVSLLGHETSSELKLAGQ